MAGRHGHRDDGTHERRRPDLHGRGALPLDEGLHAGLAHHAGDGLPSEAAHLLSVVGEQLGHRRIGLQHQAAGPLLLVAEDQRLVVVEAGPGGDGDVADRLEFGGLRIRGAFRPLDHRLIGAAACQQQGRRRQCRHCEAKPETHTASHGGRGI